MNLEETMKLEQDRLREIAEACRSRNGAPLASILLDGASLAAQTRKLELFVTSVTQGMEAERRDHIRGVMEKVHQTMCLQALTLTLKAAYALCKTPEEEEKAKDELWFLSRAIIDATANLLSKEPGHG